MNTHLLIIDPQNDFCSPQGTLYVPGANDDMTRLASLISNGSKKIDEIHVTLDSHRLIDVAHPIFWINGVKAHPLPFTIISVEDVEKGVWTTTNPSWKEKGIAYVKALAEKGRYPLCIWPPHCLIGSWGHSVAEPVSDALLEWQEARFEVVNFVTKGTNIFTEHYSAIKAEVVDYSDPSTQINSQLLYTLETADEILIAGEALSHCVASTVTDIVEYFEQEEEGIAEKIVLLEDTCSNVTGCDNLGLDFINRMTTLGMRATTTDKYLS
jgi:nicotinamidase/pyrazinamidase